MRYLAAFILVLFVAGCGYHVPGATDTWIGGDARIVYVELFDNRTAEPYLENFLADALVAELSRSRVIELTENPASADVILTGTVSEFNSSALAYGSDDSITDYQATMKIEASLKQASGELLWKQKLSRSEDYLAAVDKNLQLEGERLAAREVSKRIAEDIYTQLLNNF